MNYAITAGKCPIEAGGDCPLRPQGNWLITDAWPHKVYCSNCYETYAQADWEIWKDGSLPRAFCPTCGAQMKSEDKK